MRTKPQPWLQMWAGGGCGPIVDGCKSSLDGEEDIICVLESPDGFWLTERKSFFFPTSLIYYFTAYFPMDKIQGDIEH